MSTMRTEDVVPEWTLGDRLRKARLHAELSSEEMAEALLRTRNTIGNYESGRTVPTKRVLERWVQVCGVSLAWVRDGVAAGPSPDDGGGTTSEPGCACTRSAQIVRLPNRQASLVEAA